MRLWISVLCSAVLLLLHPVDARAQDGWPGERMYPFIMLGVGAASAPRALNRSCQGWDGRGTTSVLEARAGVQRSRFGAELRTVRQSDMPLKAQLDCFYGGPVPEAGVHTIRTPAFDRDSFTLTDVRFRFTPQLGPFTLVVLAGPGWIWSSRVATLSVASGLRVGRLLRGAVDVEWINYRTVWDELTAEWLDHAVVREIKQIDAYEWRSGFSVRLGVEVPLRM